MSTIFISYAGPQSALAFDLRDQLARKGHFCILYQDKECFPSDSDFVMEIADALVDSDYVIALVSKDYVTSNWCVKEFTLAHEAQKLIPVLVEKCYISCLPDMNNRIDVQGLTSDAMVDTIEDSLDELVPKLRSKRMNRTSVFQRMENTIIVLPLFEGGSEAERWQSRAVFYLRGLFQDENVEIVALPQYASSEEDALDIQVENHADIVLYGVFRDGSVEFGFTCSRGWNLVGGRVDINLPSDLRFKVRPTYLEDMNTALKLAFGNLESGRNRHEEAMRHYSEALGRGAAPERARNQGMQYLHVMYAYISIHNSGDLSLILEHLNEAIRIEPGLVFAYHLRSHVYSELGKLEDALFDAEHVVHYLPDNPAAINNRGFILNDMGRNVEAMDDFNAVIKLVPELETAHRGRSNVLTAMGKHQEALDEIEIALKLNPNFYVAYSARGNIYFQLGEFEKALEDFDLMIRLSPSDYSAHHSRGFILIQLGRYKDALTSFNTVIKLDPQNASAYGHRGNLFEVLGHPREALEDLEMQKALSGTTHPNFEARLTKLRELCQDS